MKQEQQRELAIECGAGIPNGVYPKALIFYPQALAAYTAAVMQAGRDELQEELSKQYAEKVSLGGEWVYVIKRPLPPSKLE